jgi:hypothetical protein
MTAANLVTGSNLTATFEGALRVLDDIQAD